MSEEKKTPEIEEKHQESKRYLIFYVIALFSVALVLILLSYMTQVKADRELATMGVQLEQQTTAVKGAEARMEVLQRTVEEQAAKLKEAEEKLAEEESQSREYLEKYKALATLSEAQQLEKQGDLAGAKQLVGTLEPRYGAERLDGMGEDELFTEAQHAVYWELMVLDVPEEPVAVNE